MSIRDIRSNFDKDYLLGLVGLETKTTFGEMILPTLGIFSLGVIVGAAAGLVFAPAKGEETRETLRNRIGEAKDYASNVVENYRGGGKGEDREV
jgi:hypothetical protein